MVRISYLPLPFASFTKPFGIMTGGEATTERNFPTFCLIDELRRWQTVYDRNYTFP